MGVLTFEVIKKTIAPILSLKDLVFFGSTHLVLPNRPEDQIEAGTITCWFSMEQPPSPIMGLFAKDMKDRAIPGHLSVWWEGRWRARLQSTTEDYTLLAPIGVAIDGAKHHIAVAFGPSQGWRLLIDGAQVAGALAAKLGLKDNNIPWVIGALSQRLISPNPPYIGLQFPFKGIIHSFNVYPKELNEQEVKIKMELELIRPPVEKGEAWSDGTFFLPDGLGWVPYSD